ncbi:DNA invertase Pin-like site-specific DNA recombinase [Rhodoglobus vestalii]|uniref:DNA invertase Pin-like site-specific DNA recombinase n=1 Tax=Rhodoglobus vestalii TaxID=193384 RepID=A0A8H2K9G7_9MICO|nr:recombinase family protein [Rhodoglobus vestalii]TQO21094.1 DNA invertase Pin-like site-specific DNA recombinase [Rhodoglobus vestalii]
MRAIIYTRQSLDKTGEEAGVTRQLDDCRALAVRKGLDVIAELSDNDTSATTGVRRPAFDRLLALVEQGDADTVVIWHPDRLYRRLTDLVKITDVAKDHGLTILSVRADDIDLSTPSGRMTASILGAVATHEGEHRTDRQRNAYKQRATAGEWHFSHRPFGYKRDSGRVIQVPEEAEVLHEVLNRYYVEEEPRYSIMSYLNAHGILTPKGKRWGIIQVRDLLTNGHYAGISTYNGEEVGRGKWEPIVDEKTWRAWQTRAAKRKRKSTFTAAKYLLSGIARCGVCEGVIYTKKRKDGGLSYYCTTGGCVQRSLKAVDRLIEAAVFARLKMPDSLEILRPRGASVEHLHAERTEIQDRIDNLAELVADGTLTGQAVREAAKPLRSRLKMIDESLAAVETVSAIPSTLFEPEVERNWISLSLPQKRAIIRALMEISIARQANPRVFQPEKILIKWQGSSEAL